MSHPTSLSDEQQAADTLPEGLPISGELIVDLSSREATPPQRLPTRKSFDEEPTRKQHAPKLRRFFEDDEVTEPTDVSKLFRNRA